ncbi:MAG: hypothetical protein IJS45_05990 [Clostridia bacterium]|nr:hypothetical protein [Clostridia bacterium]
MTDNETRKKEKPERTVSEETLAAKAALDAYEASPDYESKYANAISALADRILKDEGFSYNYSTDPSYMAAREQSEIERRRAASDAASNAAALTGGYANSYGVTAAGEASAKSYDSLRSMIPSLVDAAYKRWSDARRAELERLEAVRALEKDDYSKYRDEVSDRAKYRDYLADRYDASSKSDLDLYKAALSDWQKDRDYERAVYEYDADAAYKASRDAATDEQKAKQLAIDLIKANASATNAAAAYNRSAASSKSDESAVKTEKAENTGKSGAKTSGDGDAVTSIAGKKLVGELSAGAISSDGTVSLEFVERVKKAKNAGSISAEEYNAIMEIVRGIGTEV